MQAAVLYGPRDVRFEDRPAPTIVEPTDAIIRLSATCILRVGSVAQMICTRKADRSLVKRERTNHLSTTGFASPLRALDPPARFRVRCTYRRDEFMTTPHVGSRPRTRYSVLDADVCVRDAAQQCLCELIRILAGLPRQFSEAGLQRGVNGDRGRGHRTVLAPDCLTSDWRRCRVP